MNKGTPDYIKKPLCKQRLFYMGNLWSTSGGAQGDVLQPG